MNRKHTVATLLMAILTACLAIDSQAGDRNTSRSSTTKKSRVGSTATRIPTEKELEAEGRPKTPYEFKEPLPTFDTSPVDTSYPALSYFDADEEDFDTINSYLLAMLSMEVYSQQVDIDDFQNEMWDLLEPMGAVDVEVFMNPWTGTEGAIVTLPEATIIVFRGTSNEGTPLQTYFADHIADGYAKGYRLRMMGMPMYAHRGFWIAADSVWDIVLEAALVANLEGRKIWVTGHSLGAACATLTAMRLHYVADIPVQGLETFGSPKVGDGGMQIVSTLPNDQGVSIWQRTRRWVIDGDPLTTFFHGGHYSFGPTDFDVFYYKHIGTTNTIYPLDDGGFEVDLDTGEDKNMEWVIEGIGQEHMQYEEALREELVRVLSNQGSLSVIEDILGE